MALPTKIEIAQSAKLKPITEIAANLGLSPDDIEMYGKYKAKIRPEDIIATWSDTRSISFFNEWRIRCTECNGARLGISR